MSSSSPMTKWRVRGEKDAPAYAENNSLFSIKYHHGGFFEWVKGTDQPVGYGDGLIDFIDNCDPEELNYLAIVGMAGNLGYLDTRFLYFKKVESNIRTDLTKLEFDIDVKNLGKYVDDNRVVEVYCEGYYTDENEGDNEISSGSDDDSEWVAEDIVDHDDNFSDYVDSDGEQMGIEGDVLVDVGIDLDFSQKPKHVSMPDHTQNYVGNADVSVLDEGYIDSDHFSDHSESDIDEDNFILKTPVFNKTDLHKVELKLGMRFPTGQDFKDAIDEYSVQQGKSIKFKVNSRAKKFLYCANTKKNGQTCDWKMYCAKMSGDETVQIRTFNDNHTCSRSIVIASVKPRFIAKKFLEMIRLNPKWSVKYFREYVAKTLQAEVSLPKAYRSFKIAKNTLEGSSAQQYELLWDYCYELKRSNPGSTVEMKVKPNLGPNGESVFRGLYICWGSLKRGFLEGCRPLIGIDGCHLSGPHKGVMLTAVSIDPNNCIYPFAYAIVGVESYKTWKWFLKLLVKDINIDRAEDYTFMSDKQKGLIKAVEEVLPGVEHRFCVWHLYNNFKLLHKGIALKALLWKIARSTTKPQFTRALEEMKALDPVAYEWLAEKPGQHWSKSHFSTHPKCDILVNNLCESFNSAIKQARGKPILSMLEDVRLYLMDLVMRKKVAIEKVKNMTKLCPTIHKKLEMRKQRSHEWVASFNGKDGFEVTGPFGKKYEVDVVKHHCGCRSWQLSGIPCPHAIACLNYNGVDPEDVVHLCYSKDVYRKTYANVMMPINGRELWHNTGKVKVLPPLLTVKKGRPVKKRRLSQGEQVNNTKLSRKGTVIRCKKCKKEGHNSRTCGRPERPDRPKKKTKLEGRVAQAIDGSESDSERDTEVNGGNETEVNGDKPENDGMVGEQDDRSFFDASEIVLEPDTETINENEQSVMVGEQDDRSFFDASEIVLEPDTETINENEQSVMVGEQDDRSFFDASEIVLEPDTETINENEQSVMVGEQDHRSFIDAAMREQSCWSEGESENDFWLHVAKEYDNVKTTLKKNSKNAESGVPSTQESGVTLFKTPTKIPQPQRKQPVRRSQRLLFSPNKKPNVTDFVDLTNQSGGTLHAGIMKVKERSRKIAKGQVEMNGKIFTTIEAYKVSLQHEKINEEKYGKT